MSVFDTRWTPGQAMRVAVDVPPVMFTDLLPSDQLPNDVVAMRVAPVSGPLIYRLDGNVAGIGGLFLAQDAPLDLGNVEQIKGMVIISGAKLAVQFFTGSVGTRR